MSLFLVLFGWVMMDSIPVNLSIFIFGFGLFIAGIVGIIADIMVLRETINKKYIKLILRN